MLVSDIQERVTYRACCTCINLTELSIASLLLALIVSITGDTYVGINGNLNITLNFVPHKFLTHKRGCPVITYPMSMSNGGKRCR